MAGDKISVSFDVQPDDIVLLDKAVKDYDLPDRSKALRCLIDYLAEDGDWDEVFDVIRCRRC
jgi:hypothetical protein